MNIFRKKRKPVNDWCPKFAVWLLCYKDDLTFNDRQTKAIELIYKYQIISPDGAKEVFKDFDIPCGTWKDLCVPKEVEGTQYLIMPFYPNN